MFKFDNFLIVCKACSYVTVGQIEVYKDYDGEENPCDTNYVITVSCSNCNATEHVDMQEVAYN